jgi:hypothetical protein
MTASSLKATWQIMSHFTAYPHSPIPNAGCKGRKVFFMDREYEVLHKPEGVYYDVKCFCL